MYRESAIYIMFIKLFSLLLIITLKTARCSLVIDSISQRGIYVSDYCPSMPYCKEGAHVMCMYYNANSVMGPRCHNAVNITLSPNLASQLMDVMNAIRSKIANGQETGKDDKLLPRGYGIYRLRWDSELATFAQVLANQCIIRHDMCRATKRFPNPGQTVGAVRFSYPDWIVPFPSEKGAKNPLKDPGLTDEKMVVAITQALKSWYTQKSAVTEQMLQKQPDWTQPSTSQSGKLYLQMIFGSTTHIGCGMSAYADYNANGKRAHNRILLVCNYSSRPQKGGSTYNTKPPSPGLGYSPQCGCPPGTIEDADCLCNEHIEPSPQRARETTCPNGDTKDNCEPTLVLLPIFTMEDAPPEKLIEQAESIKDPLKNYILQRIDNSTGYPRSRMSVELPDVFDDIDKESLIHHPPTMPQPLKSVMMQQSSPSHTHSVIYRAPIPPPVFPKTISAEPPPPPPRTPPRLALRHSPQQPRAPVMPSRAAPPPPRPTRPPPEPPSPPPPPPRIPPPPPPVVVPPPLDQINEILKAHYDQQLKPQSTKRRPVPRPPPKRPLVKKASIFTRVAQFKLPGRKNMPSPFETAKKDVPPRKDFSNLHKVVNDYLKRRSGYRRNNNDDTQHDEENHIEVKKRFEEELNNVIIKQRNANKKHVEYKQRDEIKKRDESTLRDEVKQHDEYKQQHEVKRRDERNQRNEFKQQDDDKHRDEVKHRYDDIQHDEDKHDEVEQQFEDRRVEYKLDPVKQHEDKQDKLRDEIKQHDEPKQEETKQQQQKKTGQYEKPKEVEKPHTDAPITETGLKKAEENVINFNEYLKQKENYTKISVNNKDIDVKGDVDNKLMSLLDTLEKEVKHVALAGSEKEIFDAKIRKIYGSVVGEPVDLTTLKPVVATKPETEINIGELKRAQHEPTIINEIKIPENPQKQIRQFKHEEVEAKSDRMKNYEYSVQRKDTFIDNYGQNKYIENIDTNVFSDTDKKRGVGYDRKYNERYEQRYRDVEHKYMDDIDHKYSENLDRKYSENNLDHGNYDVHKYVDNYNQKYHYNVDPKYDENSPALRNQIKYDTKDVVEFREFKHNALSSAEENSIKYRNFDKFVEKDIKPHVIIDRNLYRNKDERKHRNRVQAKRVKSVLGHNDLDDPLSLERRKYYQEKLDNIERKLRGSRNSRRRIDQQRNDRPMRRMRPSRDGVQRTRSKSQADSFYMPERARFLHGY